jgi:CheY-like chemotaxis protein
MVKARIVQHFDYIELTKKSQDNSSNVIRLLLVDDTYVLLQLSKEILSMQDDFEIDTATSADEAFKKMERQSYDVIVSDYEMPHKDGLEFLRALREQNNETPFILFAGVEREIASKALSFGANCCTNDGSAELVYDKLSSAIRAATKTKKP